MLPNGDHAVVEIVKLTDYCLNPEHPRGRNKARVFAASIGFRAEHANQLRHALLQAARTLPATPDEVDDFGQRFVIDFWLEGPAGQAQIRSSWIIRSSEDFPRLTSCYVL